MSIYPREGMRLKRCKRGKCGVPVPSLWAELGDAPGRWDSLRLRSGQALSTPSRAGLQRSLWSHMGALSLRVHHIRLVEGMNRASRTWLATNRWYDSRVQFRAHLPSSMSSEVSRSRPVWGECHSLAGRLERPIVRVGPVGKWARRFGMWLRMVEDVASRAHCHALLR